MKNFYLFLSKRELFAFSVFFSLTFSFYNSQIPGKCTDAMRSSVTGYFGNGSSPLFFGANYGDTPSKPLYWNGDIGDVSVFTTISGGNVSGSNITRTNGAYCTPANTRVGDTVTNILNVDGVGPIDDNAKGSVNGLDAGYMSVKLTLDANSPSLFVNKVTFKPNTSYSYFTDINKSTVKLENLRGYYRVAIINLTDNIFTWVTSANVITPSDPTGYMNVLSCSAHTYRFDIPQYNTTGYEMVKGKTYEVRLYATRSGGSYILYRYKSDYSDLPITDDAAGEAKINAQTASDMYVMQPEGQFSTRIRRIDQFSVYGKMGTPSIPNYNLNCGQTSSIPPSTILATCTDKVLPTTSTFIDIDGVTKTLDPFRTSLQLYDSTGSNVTKSPGLAPGTYTAGYFFNYGTSTVPKYCALSDNQTTFDIKERTTTWNGNWDNGTPTFNSNVILNSNYDTGTNGSFSACNLTLNSPYTLDIKKDTFAEVQKMITNNSTQDKLIVRSDGNLVQKTDNISNVGAGITVYRDAGILTSSTLPQYNYWSSPINSKNIKTLYSDGSTPLYTYYYDTVNDYFYVLGYSKFDVNTKAIPGMGYAIRASTTNSNAKFVADLAADYNNGSINYKNQTLNATNTGLETGGSGSYNLVGNPYPSNLDLEALYNQNKTILDTSVTYNNLDATFLFWDYRQNTALKQYGTAYLTNYPTHSYAIYNVLSHSGLVAPNSSVNTNNSSDTNVKKPNGIVRVGQGFLVSALSKSPLVFSNTMRTVNSADANNLKSYFFGRNSNSKSSSENLDRFWLKITSPIGLGNTSAIVYIDGASDSFDDYDSEQLEPVGDDIFSYVDDKNIAINGKKSFTDVDKVPLGVSYYQEGDYIISLDSKDGIFSNGQPIYLYDKVTKTITNLQESPYKFSVSSIGSEINRFEILYLLPEAMAVSEASKPNVIVYKDANDFVVKSQNQKILKLEVLDMSGRIITTKNPNAFEVSIPTEILSKGTYLIKINIDGKTLIKKIIK